MQFHRLVLSCMLVCGAGAVQAQDAYLLQWLPLNGASGSSINERGSVVVGTSNKGDRTVATAWDARTLAGRTLEYTAGVPTCEAATDVNDARVIVGQSADAAGVCRPARWVGGARSFLSSGGLTGIATAINQQGVTVGVLFDPSKGPSPTVWYKNKRTDLTLPYPYFDCFVYGITNSNFVVGSCNSITPVQWDLTTGTSKVYNVLFEVKGVNNLGEIVGRSYLVLPGGVAGVLRNGTVELIPQVPGTIESVATAINDAGVVVGDNRPEDSFDRRAWIWKQGAVTDLNDYLSAEVRAAGWVLRYASAISNDGKIVGTAYNDLTFEVGSYLLTPIVQAGGR